VTGHGAVEENGIGTVDRDAEHVGRFAIFRIKTARIESSGSCWIAGVLEVAHRDIVLPRVEVELQYVAYGRLDGIGGEFVAILSDVDVNRGGDGLRDGRSHQEDGLKHDKF